MGQITLTETGLIGIITLCIGFVITFCKTAEQSRCRRISIGWGCVKCERNPLPVEAILELNSEEQQDIP
jgi:uncharacterized protein (DUF111 family)